MSTILKFNKATFSVPYIPFVVLRKTERASAKTTTVKSSTEIKYSEMTLDAIPIGTEGWERDITKGKTVLFEGRSGTSGSWIKVNATATKIEMPAGQPDHWNVSFIHVTN